MTAVISKYHCHGCGGNIYPRDPMHREDRPPLQPHFWHTSCWEGAKVETDAVDHPEHYGGDTVYETIKVIEAWGLGFHLGNAVKYISRAGRKSDDVVQDLEKARWYLDREITQLKAKLERLDAEVDEGIRRFRESLHE